MRFLIAALILMSAPAEAAAERYALIVSGATGGQEYARQYAEWTDTLSAILVDRMKFERERIIRLADADDDGAVATAANVRKTLVSLREKLAADDLLFVVLIGHGTFDGVDAKFNLVGPDLESSQWLELLDAIPARLVLVNTTAGSFPFIERLSGDRRVVVTATDSLISQPYPDIHMPAMMCRHMPASTMFWSSPRIETVRSPQSGGYPMPIE